MTLLPKFAATPAANKLIQRIEYDERLQMELWGTAQQKFASDVDLNQPIEPLTLSLIHI